jgi:hypothetical protein
LPPQDVTRRRGFPVTTIERTLIDLGTMLSPRLLKREVESMLVRGVTTFDRVEEVFMRVCRQGRPGSRRVREVLIQIDGTPPTESELEAMFIELLHGTGLPDPVGQVVFDWADGEKGRVDFWFPDARLIVELDGRRFHARLAAFERDRLRDQLALLNGETTVRFTHHQVTNSPAHVLRVVRALVGDPNRVQKGP